MNHDYKFNDENACEASPVLRSQYRKRVYSQAHTPLRTITNHHSTNSPPRQHHIQYKTPTGQTGQSPVRPLRGTPQAFQTQTRTPSPTKRNAITLSKPSNVVLLGDSKCGKSTLILSYMNQRFTRAPTFFLFETYDKSINFNNDTTVDLQIWDFPGSHDFDRFRPLAYANAAGIIICFDLATPESFHNVKDRWIPEVEEHCPWANRILLGLGGEVRLDKDYGKDLPNVDFLEKSATKLGCKYFECFFNSPRSYSRVFELMLLMINEPHIQPSPFKQLPVLLGIDKTRCNTMHNEGGSRINRDESKSKLDSKRRTSFHKRKHNCTVM